MTTEEHHRDVFYSIDKLSYARKIELFEDAKNKSYDCRIDILKGWTRERCPEISFEEMMKCFNESCYATFIHRKGYVPKDQNDKEDIWRWKLEISFSTIGTKPLYYLWIFVEQDDIDYFIQKYGMTAR